MKTIINCFASMCHTRYGVIKHVSHGHYTGYGTVADKDLCRYISPGANCESSSVRRTNCPCTPDESYCPPQYTRRIARSMIDDRVVSVAEVCGL